MSLAYRVPAVGPVGRLRLWLERRRGRRVLASLDRHALHDIGLSRLDALQESRKPFWRS